MVFKGLVGKIKGKIKQLDKLIKREKNNK